MAAPPRPERAALAQMTRPERAALAATALLTAVAAMARYGGWAPLLAFALATVALGGLAWMVSFGTEQLGDRYGPGVTGLLQSTVGNLPELFVVLFALGAGEVVVAQSALVGSVFANALLVLGLTIIAGARHSRDGVMRFRQRLPRDAATLMMLAAFIIVLVGVSFGAGDRASHHINSISVIAAVLLLIVYGSWVVPYAREDELPLALQMPRLSLRAALGLLLAAAVAAAFVSDWLVHSLGPAIHELGISRAFAGLVIVAIAGNAVEHFAAIVVASKGRADLAISVVKNSVVQILGFLYPVLVIASLAFSKQLTFSLAPVYTAALALTAVAVWQITDDGEARAYEGWALIATYAVLGTIALYE
jgi:Ca2+:H+ antiporter